MIYRKSVRAIVWPIALIIAIFAASSSTNAQVTVNKGRSEQGVAPGAGHIHTTAVPLARVVTKVDESNRKVLYGHVPAVVKRAQDLGRVDPGTPAEHMVMVLKSSDQQKAELRRVLDEQQDARTANYHQWITPEEFGDHFGVHDSDIAKVSAWLTSHGFKVEDVSKSKRVLHFSGTTGQLESAFHTEIHSYQLGNEKHASVSKEISVPAALAPVIAGVPMSNFVRKNRMTPIKKIEGIKKGPKVYGGACTSSAESSCNDYVGPFDFSTIFNTAPLLNAGTTGTGSSIAIVGRSDIQLSDVQSYRQMFNLPANDPIFIHAGQDNGVEPGDDGESDLDVEISGGIAPTAQLYFVIGTPTFLVDGITNSFEYIIENNLADIISTSYGDCESNEGAGGNEFNLQAFEQAAAQGESVFIASGDNGPAECDDSNDNYENLGYATGGEASTPYGVAVGGTAFDEGTLATSNLIYWNTASSIFLNNANSYIPEWPWNGSKNSDASLDPSADLAGIWSGSGGISAYYLEPSFQFGPGVPASDPTLPGGDWVTGFTITNPGSGYTKTPTVTVTGGGCTTEPAVVATLSGTSLGSLAFNYGTQGGTLKAGQGIGCTSVPTVTISAPTSGTTATATATIGPMQNIQPLISGVPHRYTPDLSLAAEVDHDGTVFCSEGDCENPSPGQYYFDIVGGTSVAAPSMAGIQALINEANGGRQGMPAYIYYSLANAQSTSACNSQTLPGSSTSCAFQDMTTGDNLICGNSGGNSACSAKIGFTSTAGYDLATGLGTPNAANLASQWKSVVFNSTNTTLNLSQTTGISHGEAITFSGSVAPGSGTGTPTGNVAFIVSQGEFGISVNVSSGALNGPSPFATLDANGNFNVSLSNLPSGTYNVTARYAGDGNFASSLSAPVQVTVASDTSTLTLTPELTNGTSTCVLTTSNTFSYGTNSIMQASIAAGSGQGVPTGTVTFTVDGTTYASEPLDPNGNGYLVTGAISSSNCLADYLFAQSPTLSGGQHTIGASYSGDSTFAAATATPITVTVTPLAPSIALGVGATFIPSGKAEQLTATLTASSLTALASSGTVAPTGTVSFYDGATLLGTATVVPIVTYTGPGTSASAFPSWAYSATAEISTTGITATGTNSITAVYSGDTNFATVTSGATTVTVEASQVATTTVVTSSANPTTLGGRPTLTATIGIATGTAPTSGTVTFYDGTNVLGTGTVGSTHAATLRLGTATLFAAGTHNITAVYGGIAADAASTSAVFVETVAQGTTTVVLTAKTVGTSTQNYTFTALITPTPNVGLYSPNASTVQFYDGAMLIGTAQPIIWTEGQGGYGVWNASLTVNGLSAGTHTITASYSDPNFALSTSNAQTVFVGGAPTVSWATPAAITYGTALTASQLNASANIPGTYSYSPALGTVLNAGTQTLSVTFTPADYSDFKPMVSSVHLVVNPASTSIIWATPAPIPYGTPLSATQLNAVAANGIQGSYSYSQPLGTVLPAGNYSLQVNFTPTSSNYNSSTATVSLVVTPAPLTVTVNPASFTYGGALPTFTGSVSGLVNGDTSNAKGVARPAVGRRSNNGNDIQVTYSTTVPASSNVGTYSGAITATVGGSAAGNYTVTVVPAALTITAAPLNVTVNPASFAYGGSLPTFSGSVTGLVNGDTTDVVVTYALNPSIASASSPVGTYPGAITATVGGTAAGNYTATVTPAALTISQAALTVTVNPAAFTYGGSLPTFTGTVSGLVDGDNSNAKGVTRPAVARNVTHRNNATNDITVTYSTSVPASSNVGDYPGAITATVGGSAAGNYVVTVVPADLTITAAPLTVTVNPASFIYGGSLPSFTGTVSGLVNGDTSNVKGVVRPATVRRDVSSNDIAVTYSTTVAATSGVGDYSGAITATVGGTAAGNYTVTVVPADLTITPAPLTVTVNAASFTYGGTLPAFTGSVSGLVDGDTSNARGIVRPAVASRNAVHGNNATNDIVVTYALNPAIVTATSNAGTYPAGITATVGGSASGNYTITVDPGTLTITQAGQTITFAPIASQKAGISLALSATSTSGLAVSFASTTPSVCTVAGSEVTLVSAGNCTIVASQPGNTDYAAASQVSRTFTVTTSPQTINFSTPGSQPYGSTLTLAGTDTSGLPITYTSLTTGVCTVSGSSATMTNLGTCSIKASQPGNGAYNAANPVTVSFSVIQASQTITFVTPSSLAAGATAVLAPTASSGLTVTLQATPASVCTLNGNTLTAVAAGSCSVIASQIGNTDYKAANGITRTVNITLVPQTIAFTTSSPQTAGTTVNFTPTSTSGLSVTLTSNSTSICTVSGDMVTLLAPGTCSITATQPGNSVYAAAKAVTSTFSVVQLAQTINFSAIATQYVGSTITLNATSTASLPVTFTTSTSTVCTITDNSGVYTANLIAPGNCKIVASAAGNTEYKAATPVTQSFAVDQIGQSINFPVPPTQIVATQYQLGATASSGLAITYTSESTSVCTVSSSGLATMVAKGTCKIEAAQTGNAQYKAASNVIVSFLVNPAS